MNIDNPNVISHQYTATNVRQQFADTMLSVGSNDEKLVVVVGDISHGILQPFAQACPERFYNIGILEPTTISLGAGLSRSGLTPVIHTIAPFLLERSFEQIKLDFCYHKVSGNIVTVGGAFDYANLGVTHHCYGDFALMKTLENTQIMAAASPVEFDQLFKQSYNQDAVNIFKVCGNIHNAKFSKKDIVFGKALKLFDGETLTLIATGTQLNTALQARDSLTTLGWDVEIIYIHTLRPLDVQSIQASIDKTKHVVVIEEHMCSGGLGDEVLRAMQNRGSYKFISLSIPDQFVRGYGTYNDHCVTCGLTPEALISRVQSEFMA